MGFQLFKIKRCNHFKYYIKRFSHSIRWEKTQVLGGLTQLNFKRCVIALFDLSYILFAYL